MSSTVSYLDFLGSRIRLVVEDGKLHLEASVGPPLLDEGVITWGRHMSFNLDAEGLKRALNYQRRVAESTVDTQCNELIEQCQQGFGVVEPSSSS